MSVMANYAISPGLRGILRPMTRIVCTAEVEAAGLTEAVIDHVELTLRSIPWFARHGMRATLWAFELGALLWPRGALTRFSRLPPERQEAYFAAWWDGPSATARQLIKGAKGLIALGYWDHPEVRKRLEYHPEAWIAKVAAQRLNRFAGEIAAHDALVLAPAPLKAALAVTAPAPKVESSPEEVPHVAQA